MYELGTFENYVSASELLICTDLSNELLMHQELLINIFIWLSNWHLKLNIARIKFFILPLKLNLSRLTSNLIDGNSICPVA